MKCAKFSFLLMSLFLSSGVFCKTPTSFYARQLKMDDMISDLVSTCEETEKMLGQLFYVEFKGDAQQPLGSLNSMDISLVQYLNLGGIAPEFARDKDDYYLRYDRRYETIQECQKKAELPLFVGFERSEFSLEDSSAPFIFDFAKIEKILSLEEKDAFAPECVERLGFLTGFFHKVLGFNQMLGPKYDQKKSSELNPLKKYQKDSYERFSNALESLSLTQSLGGAYQVEDSRKAKTNYSVFISPENDPNKLQNLRRNVDPHFLSMTERFSKIDKKKLQYSSIPIKNGVVKNPSSLFAVEAITSGHDMVFLDQGDGDNIRRTFKDVLAVSCQKGPLGELLRNRIGESYKRIKEFKSVKADDLRSSVLFPKELVKEAMALSSSSSLPQNKLPIYNSLFCQDKKRFEEFRKNVLDFMKGKAPLQCWEKAQNTKAVLPIEKQTFFEKLQLDILNNLD